MPSKLDQDNKLVDFEDFARFGKQHSKIWDFKKFKSFTMVLVLFNSCLMDIFLKPSFYRCLPLKVKLSTSKLEQHNQSILAPRILNLSQLTYYILRHPFQLQLYWSFTISNCQIDIN